MINLEENKNQTVKTYSPWEKVLICRHPKRPHAKDYISYITDDFFELKGDRYFKDDSAIIGGIGLISGKKFMIIGQEKGNSTETRLYHNFGMPSPEGYRKALRLMELAEKFEIPVLCLIDTPGAFPGLGAEERGQGRAIADNLFKMSRIKTPIIALVIGEGCSGGALGIAVADKIAMLEHSYYSVISPEGCASILWKDASKSPEAAKSLKMHAEDLHNFKMIDKILKEPEGGAHLAPEEMMESVKSYIIEQYQILRNYSSHDLVELRYKKFRTLGDH